MQYEVTAVHYEIHIDSKRATNEQSMAKYLGEGWDVVSTIPSGWYEPREHQTEVAQMMVTYKRAIG